MKEIFVFLGISKLFFTVYLSLLVIFQKKRKKYMNVNFFKNKKNCSLNGALTRIQFH